MRDIKLRAKIIWKLLANNYTDDHKEKCLWLWTTPLIKITEEIDND